jgi:hypothetical protein
MVNTIENKSVSVHCDSMLSFVEGLGSSELLRLNYVGDDRIVVTPELISCVPGHGNTVRGLVIEKNVDYTWGIDIALVYVSNYGTVEAYTTSDEKTVDFGEAVWENPSIYNLRFSYTLTDFSIFSQKLELHDNTTHKRVLLGEHANRFLIPWVEFRKNKKPFKDYMF